MNEIRTTKIDGVEFVTYKDYLRLKEEKEKIENLIEISKTKGKKVVKSGKCFVMVCGDMSEPMVRLEDFQMIAREREKLKKEKQELEYLGDINEELKEENKKLKEERDNRKDEYKKAIDRENERVYNCNEYYAETMETRRKNMELKDRIAELEKCNLNLQEQIDKLLNHNK